MIWIAYGAIIVATFAALYFARLRRVSETSPTLYDPPSKVERNDFADCQADTLVVLFTSRVCDSCLNVSKKASVLRSSSVDVVNVEYEDPQGKKLHSKYQIEAVPTLIVCDANGVTQKAFVGPVTATDLWAAVASARGTEVESCANHTS